MENQNIYWRGVLAALSVAVVCMFIPAAIGDLVRPDAVEIRLRQRVRFDGGVVRVVDIADVQGGSVTIRQRIKQLDVAELLRDIPFAIVRPRQVRMRCLVAGLRDRQFVITGATSSLVDMGSATTERPITPAVTDSQSLLERLTLDAIRTELAAYWQIPGDELFIRLQRPLQSRPVISESDTGLSVKAYLPANATPGSISLMTEVNSPGSKRVQSTVSVNALHRPHGDTSGQVKLLGHRTDSANSTPDRLGILSPRQKPGPIVVRSRDRLKLTAKRGGLRVTVADAEALENGRVGDSLRIRNPRSRKIVVARLVSPTEAVIEF